MKSTASDRIKQTIIKNAAEIVRLHTHTKQAFAQRNQSPEKWSEFYQAGVDFASHYNSLAFPRGLNGAYERIDSGDPVTIEEAICFLEVRPYFIRSGYMFKDILRKCNRAQLSPAQAARLEVVKEKQDEWKRLKSLKAY
jgi:hypothetical protein